MPHQVGCGNYPTDAPQQTECVVLRIRSHSLHLSTGLNNPMVVGPASGFDVALKVAQVGPLGLAILRVAFKNALHPFLTKSVERCKILTSGGMGDARQQSMKVAIITKLWTKLFLMAK